MASTLYTSLWWQIYLKHCICLLQLDCLWKFNFHLGVFTSWFHAYICLQCGLLNALQMTMTQSTSKLRGSTHNDDLCPSYHPWKSLIALCLWWPAANHQTPPPLSSLPALTACEVPNESSGLLVATWNLYVIPKKHSALLITIIDLKLDFFTVTEVWEACCTSWTYDSRSGLEVYWTIWFNDWW